MIEVYGRVDPALVIAYLEAHVRPHLTPDKSSYAPGRLRAWLGVEPSLHPAFPMKLALPVSDETWTWFEAAIGWRFDYALVTYSGDEASGVKGIAPHRDAAYASPLARGWHLSGSCTFSYWPERGGFGGGTSAEPRSRMNIELQPGDLWQFDCKNLHAAAPSPGRWAMNFWKAKR